MTLIQLTSIVNRGKISIYINMDQIAYMFPVTVDEAEYTQVGVLGGKTPEFTVEETTAAIITKIIEIKKQILGGSFAEYLIGETDR